MLKIYVVKEEFKKFALAKILIVSATTVAFFSKDKKIAKILIISDVSATTVAFFSKGKTFAFFYLC